MTRSRNKKKSATIKTSPDDQKPIWVFRDLDEDKDSPWRLSDAGKDLHDILVRLGEWEKQTWHEIKIDGAAKNHSCAKEQLTSRAQRCLKKINKDSHALMALHIGNTKVLYGFRDGAAFHILWYDPDHRYGNHNCVYEPTLPNS